MSQPHPIELQVPGTFIGINPKGWGPLTLQPCQCRACVRIRAFNEGWIAKEADR
jgi:hypothetical protein